MNNQVPNDGQRADAGGQGGGGRGDSVRLLERGAGLLQLGGVLVFVVAAICALLFLLFSSVYVAEIEAWVRLRTMELFAMVAAVGIVVAVIARTDNAFVSIFGILLIGALIVPTKDMVSLALFASGREVDTFRDSDAVDAGSEFQSRAIDLGTKIIFGLQLKSKELQREGHSSEALYAAQSPTPQESSLPNQSFEILNSDLIRNAIVDAIWEEQLQVQLDRVKLGGYLPALLSFGEGLVTDNENDPEYKDKMTNSGFQQYYFRHGREENFLRDLYSLRRQDLISFSYADFSEAEITAMGKSVVCKYYESIPGFREDCPYSTDFLRAPLDLRSLGITDFATRNWRAKEHCENVSAMGSIDLPATLETTKSSTVPFSTEVSVSSSGTAIASLEATTGGDPFLVLFRVDEIDGVNSCTELSANDDHDGLNSLLRDKLDPNTKYMYVSLDLHNGNDIMNLKFFFYPERPEEITPESTVQLDEKSEDLVQPEVGEHIQVEQ